MGGRAADEEDYWNSSANLSFNFDDDESTVPQFSTKSNHKLFFEDNVSESSYDISQNEPPEMPLHMIISEQDLRKVIEEQSMEEIIIPKKITLEEEVRLLRSQLREFSNPSANHTITKIILNKPVRLEAHKSLQDKERLLDEAISSGCGDAILFVVLFLVRTLKKKFVHSILKTRPAAIDHYLHYLTLRLQVSECTELLVMLGRHQEAALLQFQIAVNNSAGTSPEVKKQKLKKIYSDYFSQPGICNSYYSQMVANYINLLEFQLSEKAIGHVGASDIVSKSVLRTLFYVCSKYKWGSDDKSPENPQIFADIYQVTPAQYQWVAMNERGHKQAWRDLELLFEKKSWHNLTQKSFNISIPIERMILRLFSLNAPVAVLNLFLGRVDDPHKKLTLAKRVRAVRSWIDVLVTLKDRPELERLRDTLENGTEEKFYAEKALKGLNSKWTPDSISINKFIK